MISVLISIAVIYEIPRLFVQKVMNIYPSLPFCCESLKQHNAYSGMNCWKIDKISSDWTVYRLYYILCLSFVYNCSTWAVIKVWQQLSTDACKWLQMYDEINFLLLDVHFPRYWKLLTSIVDRYTPFKILIIYHMKVRIS